MSQKNVLIPVTDLAARQVWIIWVVYLNFLGQDEFVELAVFVGVTLYHAQFAELLEYKHIAEDVPVGDRLFLGGVGPDLSLVNFIASYLPDLKLVPVNVAGFLLFFFVQMLVVVFSELEEHGAVFIVVVEMATVQNRENVL